MLAEKAFQWRCEGESKCQQRIRTGIPNFSPTKLEKRRGQKGVRSKLRKSKAHCFGKRKAHLDGKPGPTSPGTLREHRAVNSEGPFRAVKSTDRKGRQNGQGGRGGEKKFQRKRDSLRRNHLRRLFPERACRGYAAFKKDESSEKKIKLVIYQPSTNVSGKENQGGIFNRSSDSIRTKHKISKSKGGRHQVLLPHHHPLCKSRMFIVGEEEQEALIFQRANVKSLSGKPHQGSVRTL